MLMISNYKKVLKDLIPPLLFKVIDLFRKNRKHRILFKGSYSSWDEAMNHATGYDSDLILNKVKEAALKVKNGRAAFERDSVLFDKVLYSFPLLAGLLRVAVANNGRLNVLDFGGSLGSSYYQCKSFLSGVKQLRWSIVEQEKFVTCGRDLFENDELKFYYNIDECLQYEEHDIILFSGVLQYIKEPYVLLEKVIKHNFKHIIIDRTPFADIDDDILTIEIVTPSIYEASMPLWIFSTEKFFNVFRNRYSLLTEFQAIDGVIEYSKAMIHFKGFIFDERH